MNRRNFIQSMASLPIFSSLDTSVGKIGIENEEDSFWSLYSTWMQKSGNYEGQIKVWRNKELEYEWTYDDYSNWFDVVSKNVAVLSKINEMEVPMALPFPGVKLSSVYIDAPYYSNVFYDHIKEIPIVINDGKYSEYQHEAHVDGDLIARKDSLIDLLQEVSGEL